MHGVPILIKDNIDVAGLLTTAESLVRKDHRQDVNAPLVARLWAAGTVILGKADMTGWANFMTLGIRNGHSSLGGATINPWDDELDTGGSSWGSGVAVTAWLWRSGCCVMPCTALEPSALPDPPNMSGNPFPPARPP